ncbi:putative lipopolysaccharide biosynthesis O-acetyl transferase WbbJ [Klebsiella pneumoniae]|nr:putative lipopolysaccharide biosynthesis O-acetyl transferase WbbJ [Klebsiella pneumoniae]
MIFNKVIERISILKNRCRSSECSIIGVLFRMLMFRLVYKKNILTSPKVKIKNIKNIKFHKNSNLIVGLSNVSHVNNNSIFYINNRGEMHVSGNVFIAKSVRVDIADSSKIILNDCYIGPETDLISYSGISIGKGSMVSWRVQFLDEDFHLVSYNDKKPKDGQITIGENCLIGNNVAINKGCIIADGCVVASHSVVNGVFLEKNCLIAGVPARVIKRNISWQH